MRGQTLGPFLRKNKPSPPFKVPAWVSSTTICWLPQLATWQSPSHSLVAQIQSPSPVGSPSLTTLQDGASPSCHPAWFAFLLTVFHLVYHDRCLDGLPLPTHLSTHPSYQTDLAFTLLVPTSHPVNPPFTAATADGVRGFVPQLHGHVSHLLPWGFSHTM